ncbi:RNA-directed DNA polymerase, eukaryota, reverse transcriptase zinc-binding domain protein [Tanacetum coccineum]
MAWYRKKKKGFMVFKVDFEKAYDSLRWYYLDVVMENLRFSSKWRKWIAGCMSNSRASIMVNGSPTTEFEIFKGLRQGDRLSPFLFILAMEGLHAITCKAVNIGLFKGAIIGEGGDLGDKKVTWVKWNVCLASKALGGLSIGSIYALNMSFLFKCIWRFCCNSKLISRLERLDASMDQDGEGDKKCNVAHRINVSNLNMVLRRAPRGGVESSQLEDLKALIQNILILDNKDGWKWFIDSNGFSVASARKYN